MGSMSPSPSSSPTASPPSNTLNPLPPLNTNPNRTRTSNPPVISPAPPPVPSALPPSPPSEAPIPDPPPPASPPLKPPTSSAPPQGPPPAASSPPRNHPASSPLPPPESPSPQQPSPSAAHPAATPHHSRPRSFPASPPARTPTASTTPPVAALPHSPPATPAATAAPPPGTSHQPQLPTARSVQPIRNISADNGSVGSQGLRSGSIIAVSSFVGFLALTLAVFFVWFVNRRKKINGGPNIDQPVPSVFASSHNTDSTFLRPQYSNIKCSSDAGRGASSRSWLTYEDLSEATNGFSGDNLLGQGGFGCVYKGVLMDGRPVAVKQLKAGSRQGEREFRAEVDIISRIHHRHLVSLVGYCIFENQRLLVYDYVPNNNLHYHLHGEGKLVMDWASRVKVAAGAARGLAYLHEDCQPRIIHRDIKSTNILLDNNFEARVADFGLAKLAQELDINTHVSTRVMGTFGYLAPEYASTGKLTEKSDVYSFGVVLLELITGREPVDSSQPSGDESLVEWARPLLAQALETQDFEELVDPRLDNNFNEREMFRLIESAAASIRHSASRRPRMSQIARALESMDELESLTGGIEMAQSGVFDSREHSAQIRRFDRMAFGNDDYYSSGSFSRSQNSWRS